jgi:hypothetical protein
MGPILPLALNMAVKRNDLETFFLLLIEPEMNVYVVSVTTSDIRNAGTVRGFLLVLKANELLSSNGTNSS